MTNTTKKLASFVLCFLMLFTCAFNVYATNVSKEDQEKIDAYKEKQDALKDKIDAAKEKVNDLNGTIEEKQSYADKLSGEIDEYQASIDSLQKDIDVLEVNKTNIQTKINELDGEITEIDGKIDENEAETKRLETEIDDVYKKFKDRLCEIYVNGTTSDLELLLDFGENSDFESYLIMLEISQRRAKSDTEMVECLNNDILTIDKLTEEYNSMIDVLEVKKDEHQVKVDELNKQEAAIETSKNALEDSQNELLVLQTEAFTYIKELNAESATYKKLIDQYEAESKEFEAKIDKIIASSASTGTGTIQKGAFIWPLQYSDAYISSGYGYRYDPISGVYKLHGGTDTCCWSGTAGKAVSAAASGTVITAGYNAGGYGYYVVIDHGNGISTLYGHNTSLAVYSGQHVSQGQTIAYAGSTGYATGAHCHFEVRVNGARVNAAGYASLP